jgi:hypothetical protein
MDYNYSSEELELIRIINDYRVNWFKQVRSYKPYLINVKNTTLKWLK